MFLVDKNERRVFEIMENLKIWHVEVVENENAKGVLSREIPGLCVYLFYPYGPVIIYRLWGEDLGLNKVKFSRPPP